MDPILIFRPPRPPLVTRTQGSPVRQKSDPDIVVTQNNYGDVPFVTTVTDHDGSTHVTFDAETEASS